MRRIVLDLVIFSGGVAAAVAFIVSCGSGKSGSGVGVPPAAAQVPCAQYELLRTYELTFDANGGTMRLPAGWIPLNVDGAFVNSYRCAQ